MVTRADLAAVVDDDLPAARIGALAARIVAPDRSVASPEALMDTDGPRRLAVVDDDGLLIGLVCRKRSRSDFCTDAGVAARRATA